MVEHQSSITHTSIAFGAWSEPVFLVLQGVAGLFTDMVLLGVDGGGRGGRRAWSGSWEGVRQAMRHVADDMRRASPRTACHICGSSVSRANLQRHIRTHTGEKLYGCPDCHYRTGDRSNLRRHHASVHPDQPTLQM